MMKKMLVMSLVASGFMVSALAHAETQTVSLGSVPAEGEMTP